MTGSEVEQPKLEPIKDDSVTVRGLLYHKMPTQTCMHFQELGVERGFLKLLLIAYFIKLISLRYRSSDQVVIFLNVYAYPEIHVWQSYRSPRGATLEPEIWRSG